MSKLGVHLIRVKPGHKCRQEGSYLAMFDTTGHKKTFPDLAVERRPLSVLTTSGYP